jgi:VWFA-related protein
VDEIDPDLALRARHFLHTFFERHFEANDIGIVVNIGRASATAAQDFTNSRRLLLAAVDRIQGWPSVARVDFDARARAAALRALIGPLAAVKQRRKALIYLTQTASDIFGVIDYHGGVRSLAAEDLHAAMTDAMRGGVAFYTIDPAGLTTSASGETEDAPAAPDGGAELDRIANLREMSNVTGGFAIVNSNSIESSFARIVRENSNYYVIGFTSANDKRDGRYRHLEVRAKRPGLTVRTRDGYIAPSKNAERASQPVRAGVVLSPGVGETIRTPLANATVPMSASAVAYRSSQGREATVLVTAQLDVDALELAAGPTRSADVEIATVAISAAGKVTRGQHEVITLALKPDTYAQASAHGMRMLSAMTLPPGRYQLRVAGGNTKSANAGSVVDDLEVPDFSKGRLTMSAPALLMTVDEPVTSIPKSAANIVPSPPTVVRDFARTAPVLVYVEVYDNARGGEARAIDMTLSLRDEAGRVVKTVADHRPSIGGTQKFSVPVPLDTAPGQYVLRVEASVPGANDVRASHDIPVRVH